MTTNKTNPTTPSKDTNMTITTKTPIIWPPAALEDAVDKLLTEVGYFDTDSNLYGRLDSTVVRQLGRLIRVHAPNTPDEFVSTSEVVPGKPYISTGLKSLQPQIDLMNTVFGLAHWKFIQQATSEAGTYQLQLLIGNNLNDIKTITDDGEIIAGSAAEILVHKVMVGANPNGRSEADRSKGALTNAGKRLLSSVGCCADVYRFSGDADPAHNPQTTGTAPLASEKQAGFAASLLLQEAQRLVNGNKLASMIERLTRLAELADVEAPDAPTSDEDYQAKCASLVGKMSRPVASQVIEALDLKLKGTQAAANSNGGGSQAPKAKAAPRVAPSPKPESSKATESPETPETPAATTSDVAPKSEQATVDTSSFADEIGEQSDDGWVTHFDFDTPTEPEAK